MTEDSISSLFIHSNYQLFFFNIHLYIHSYTPSPISFSILSFSSNCSGVDLPDLLYSRRRASASVFVSSWHVVLIGCLAITNHLSALRVMAGLIYYLSSQYLGR